ncbi:hypothetical protein HK101_000354 [Irineochytrium annulatum]|nr:hypothetical protein HK101_000354 [Irineochytrium annulatum]
MGEQHPEGGRSCGRGFRTAAANGRGDRGQWRAAGPWLRQVTADGRIIYVNQYTGEQAVEAAGRSSNDSFASSPRLSETSNPLATPGGASGQPQRDSGYTSLNLPPGWIVFEAEDGSMVYYNGFTKETRWTPPEGTTTTSASIGSLNSASSLSADNLTSPTTAPNSLIAPVSSNGLLIRTTALVSTRQAANEGLPPNWGKKSTPEGRAYYYNMLTDETTWLLSDIDLETGELLTKKRESTSAHSNSSTDSLRRPSMVEDDGAGRVTWARLTNDIVGAVQQLNFSAKNNFKEKFIPQSSAIVETIRVMLFASGTARRDAPLVEAHRTLRVHHRSIMATLSRLVLSAKCASGVWPPPDAISKMQAAASEVLQAVKSFVNAAQEAGVEIRVDEAGEGTSGSPTTSTGRPGAPGSGQGGYPASPTMSNLNAGSLTGPNSSAGGEEDEYDEEGPQPTNSEIIAQLERFTSNVVGMIRELVRAIGGDQFNSSVLITDVRSMVTEVGNFLSVVDDLPLDSLSEDLTVDFKVNRLSLYNSISGLVMATSTATGTLAPSNALEQVVAATGLVEKAVKELLISTKFLIEEKEALEQQTLQQYIDQYGGGSGQGSANGPASAAAAAHARRPSEPVIRRRPLSLSILGPNLGDFQESSSPSDPVDPSGGILNGAPPTIGTYTSSPAMMNGQPMQQQGYPGMPHQQGMAQQYPPSGPPPGAPMFVGNGPMSAPVSRQGQQLPPGGPSDMDFMDSLGRGPNSKGKMGKIHQLLGAEAPTTSPRKGSTDSPLMSQPDKKWYLKYDYNPDDIVLNMEGKVKGGRIEALVERLTLHDSPDVTYVQTFLLTYRSFTTTARFMELLERRFLIEPPESLTEAEFADWEKQKRMPIRLRVFNVMKSWVENYCSEDSEDREVLAQVKRFAATTMQDAGSFANQLVKLCERREQNEGPIRVMIQSAGRDVPPPKLPSNLRRIRFLDLDPLEVARQLTILESKEYNKIQPAEFLLKAWSDKDAPHSAVNVKSMINMSNQVSGWVAQSILSEKDIKKRAVLTKHFISIADKCRSINNFNTLMAVLAGLNSAPIHRLKRTWDLLPARSQTMLEALRMLMNTAKNFSRYRETLHNVNPPCVPFLGFYLTDLTFIEDGSPNCLKGADDGMINFSKRTKTAEVIRDIQQYQNAPYQLANVPELQQFLKQSFMETADETALYNLSLSLEPREREDEKIARLLSESGFV